MLLVCVHVTNFVFSLSSGRRFSGVSFRSPGLEEGVHHLRVRFLILARRAQEEMLAS